MRAVPVSPAHFSLVDVLLPPEELVSLEPLPLVLLPLDDVPLLVELPAELSLGALPGVEVLPVVVLGAVVLPPVDPLLLVALSEEAPLPVVLLPDGVLLVEGLLLLVPVSLLDDPPALVLCAHDAVAKATIAAVTAALMTFTLMFSSSRVGLGTTAQARTQEQCRRAQASRKIPCCKLSAHGPIELRRKRQVDVIR